MAREHWFGADGPRDALGTPAAQKQVLPLRAEVNHTALHTAAAQRPGPLTAAFLVSHRPAAALGLCSGCFHHQEGSSSMDCSLIFFRSSFKIIFSDTFPEDWLLLWGSGSEETAILLRSPVA